jgi:hypothetical protein
MKKAEGITQKLFGSFSVHSLDAEKRPVTVIPDYPLKIKL